MAARSERLVQCLTATDLTPRSGTRYVKELANGGCDVQVQMHAEARLALAKGQFEVARALLGECPPGYADVDKLTNRCKVFEALCRVGVAVRPNTLKLRESIAKVIGAHPTAIAVAIYAEDLRAKGFTHVDVDEVTLESVGALCKTWQQGHREKVLSRARQNVTLSTRLCVSVGVAWEKCGNDMMELVRVAVQRSGKGADGA